MDTEKCEQKSLTSPRKPFAVVLRGGAPWGFDLTGGAEEGTFLRIIQVNATGSAITCLSSRWCFDTRLASSCKRCLSSVIVKRVD